MQPRRTLLLVLLLAATAAISPAHAVRPGGVVDSDRELGSDAQPPWRLPKDPIATAQGSPMIAITSPGCCVRGGAIAVWPQTWVKLENAAPVGGIASTRWLKVGRVLNDDSFEVQAPEPAHDLPAAQRLLEVAALPHHPIHANPPVNINNYP